MFSARSNRLDAAFTNGQPALICYLPLGDPLVPTGLPKLYADAGVDIFEMAVPVNDPAIDGPTITESMKRAVAAGTSVERATVSIRSCRDALPDQPMVWMSYPGQRSDEILAELAAASGVDGVLLPGETCKPSPLANELDQRGIYLVQLIRHKLPADDVRAARKARGYVMLQATPGATGSTHEVLPDSGPAIHQLRQEGVTAPIALGIGISTPAQVRQAIQMGADGVVVGSATVEAAIKGAGTLHEFLRSLRVAVDGG